ncbi:hypothetical protein CH16_gp124 [Escherichia phage KBNP1711]|uniref:Uncharacterized protein n=1 Tax=Escherichia phage KBNP1711 TaxID=1436889 RepID=W6ASE6_9CAUD|nr:hypothetical protein CH16_gp124 [Escherichia phage KBNP1711]AHI60901.1 hypothetical protein ECBP3_0124 [Escherichia phage KBNP1711]
MGTETIALIDTHNYGGVTLSFDESIDYTYLSFLTKGEIKTISFPAVYLVQDYLTIGKYLARCGILLSLEEVEQISVSFFVEGVNDAS